MQATERKKFLAAEFLEALFDRQIEIDQIDGELRVVDHRITRDLLVERLRRGIAIGDTPVFEMIFEKIGLGKSSGDLTRIVTNKALALRSRGAAFSILLGSGREPSEIQSALTDVTLFDLLAARLRDAALSTLLDESHAAAVAQILAAIPDEQRVVLLRALESVRRDVAIPAALLYRNSAGAFGAAEDALIFDALIDDANADGLELLERVDARAGNAETHARVEAAAARLRDRIVKNEGRGPEGRAVILPAFQGQTAVQLEIANPDGSSTRVALVAMRGRIEHAIVDIDEPGEAPEPAPDALVAATDLGTAAAYLARFPLADAIPQSSAAALLRAIPAGIAPAPAPASAASAAELRELFTRDTYEGWGVLPEELEAVDLAPPDDWDATDAWLDEAARGVAGEALAQRLIGETRHMSVFHAVRGEEREAGLMARAAEDAAKALEESALLRESLRKSVENARAAVEAAGDAGDDEAGDHDEYDEFEDFAAKMDPFVEVIRKQLADGIPPATRAAFEKLEAMGADEDESLRILALLLLAESREMIAAERPYDEGRWERRLALLPDVEAAMELLE